jgi:hypothetical protein
MGKSKSLGGGITRITPESLRREDRGKPQRWSRFFRSPNEVEKRVLAGTSASSGLRNPLVRGDVLHLEEAGATLCLRLQNEKDDISLTVALSANPDYCPDRSPWGPGKTASTEETLSAIRTIVKMRAVERHEDTLSQLVALSKDSSIKEAAANALSKKQ